MQNFLSRRQGAAPLQTPKNYIHLKARNLAYLAHQLLLNFLTHRVVQPPKSYTYALRLN